MRQQNISSSLLVALARKVARLHQRLRTAFASASYRPELHYMRGPGPRSIEKLRAVDMLAAD